MRAIAGDADHRRRVSGLNPAIAMGLALNLEALDDGKWQLGRRAPDLEQWLCASPTEFVDQLLEIQLQPCNDLPAISSRRPKAGLLGFENGDRNARLGKMQRGGKAAETTS